MKKENGNEQIIEIDSTGDSAPFNDRALENLRVQFQQTSELIESMGFQITKKPQQKTIDRMKTLSLEQIEKLNFQLKVTQFLSSSVPLPANLAGYNQSQVSRALDFFGLEMDPDEKDKIESDDVVEIYDQFSTQLYRSLNFFKTSGYSLEDLLLNEWYVLWERPKFVLEKLTELVGRIFQGDAKPFKIDVADHAVREIFHDEKNETQYRVLNVSMGTVFPLRKKGSQKISAFVVTTRCQVLFDGTQAEKIKFI